MELRERLKVEKGLLDLELAAGLRNKLSDS
jgi:hypothetical protein